MMFMTAKVDFKKGLLLLAGVAAVILDVVVNMAKTVFKEKRWLPVLVMIGSFVAVRFFGVNIILIILICGLIGAADTLLRGRGKV